MRLVSKSLILVLLMVTSTLSVINAETISRQSYDQPSATKNTLWLYGSEDMDSVNAHFYFNENQSHSMGNSPKGYGYKTANNERISIDLSFEFHKSQYMLLELGEVIRGTFYIESYGLTGSDCQEDFTGARCKDFTVTLKRAGIPLASDTFLTGGNGQETIIWEFVVSW